MPPTASTPGSSRTRLLSRSDKDVRRSGGATLGSPARTVSTRSGRNPSVTAPNAAKLLTRRPADTRRRTASPNWTATRIADARLPGIVLRPEDLSAAAAFRREALQAGISAIMPAAATVETIVNVRTRPSTVAWSRRGRSRGPVATRTLIIGDATASARVVATPTSKATSDSVCSTRRPAPAPSARRTANSCARAVPRARISVTTLPHAISQRATTAANSNCSARRARRPTPASTGVTVAATMRFTSARARSTGTLERSLPTTFQRLKKLAL
jgi:hypothetical protein